jgi:hypothetical protein
VLCERYLQKLKIVAASELCHSRTWTQRLSIRKKLLAEHAEGAEQKGESENKKDEEIRLGN